jgi:hypothetical protein
MMMMMMMMTMMMLICCRPTPGRVSPALGPDLTSGDKLAAAGANLLESFWREPTAPVQAVNPSGNVNNNQQQQQPAAYASEDDSSEDIRAFNLPSSERVSVSLCVWRGGPSASGAEDGGKLHSLAWRNFIMTTMTRLEPPGIRRRMTRARISARLTSRRRRG